MAGIAEMRVTGLDKVLKFFGKLPPQAQKELKAEVQFLAEEIKNAAQKDAPTDEGALKGRITTKNVGLIGSDVNAQAGYAGYQEFGTKSKVKIPAGLEDVAAAIRGSSPSQANPVEALMGWVERKGIATNGKRSRSRNALQAIKSTAFAIWRHIKRFGIKAQPFFYTSKSGVNRVKEGEKTLNQRMKRILSDLIK